jgi:hypothetical protein
MPQPRESKPETEITPEMISAGAQVLADDEFYCGSLGLAELKVSEILAAAIAEEVGNGDLKAL